jgi:transcriptional regulator with XRE-family HTH domain
MEKTDDKKSIGGRLRTARLAAGLSLKQVAGVISYTWVAVQRWEKGACLPKPGVLRHLAHLYHVDDQW